jgi:hypothetical protein
MNEILRKLLEKYLIHKTKEMYGEELQRINKEKVKKWMEDKFVLDVDYSVNNLIKEFYEEIEREWNYNLKFEIDNFIDEAEKEKIWTPDYEPQEIKQTGGI